MFLVMVISFFLMNIARSSLESFDSWRVGVLEDERTELVTDGIYTLCRHPFVVFSLAEATALLVAVPHAAAVPLLGALLLLSHQVVLREEQALLRQHASAYALYGARTGRYVPGCSYLRLASTAAPQPQPQPQPRAANKLQ